MPRWAEFEWGGGESSPNAAFPPGFLDAFSSSMPPRYRVLFDPRTTRKHAAICYRRGKRPAHVEVWRTLADGSAALCVVADDRPGLLSAVAAALVFSRSVSEGSDGPAEAVDLVWVRRANSDDRASIDEDEAASVGEVLSA